MSEKDKDKENIDASSTDKDKDKDVEVKDKDKDVEVKERKTRKIQINVSRDKEIEALQKELAEFKLAMEAKEEKWEEEKQKLEDEKVTTVEELTEKKAILEKQALEAFEKDKKEIMELAKSGSLSDEQLAEIEEKLSSPKNLSIVKGLITMLAPKKDGDGEGDKGTGEGTNEKKPPAGKATFTPPKDAKQYENPEALIGELYHKGYYATDVTLQERNDAREKIDKLFEALIGGKAWAQMKAGYSGSGSERFPEAKITECPRCKEIIVGEPLRCPKCGVDLQQKMRKRGEVD